MRSSLNGPCAHQTDIHGADADLALGQALLHKVAWVGNPEAGVGEHVQEVGVAMRECDPQPVVGQDIDGLDVSQLAFEVGRRAGGVPGPAAGVDKVEPELGVLNREWRSVVPVDVVTDGESPLREARICDPLGGQVGADDVDVVTAPHDQVARPEERPGDVVEGNAAGAKGVEAGGRVAAIGEASTRVPP